MSDTMSIDDNTRVYDEKDAPMTELSPRTQRLLEAVDLMNLGNGVGDTAKMVTVPSYILSKVRAARAAFEPEPEMVYVLAEKMPDAFINWAWEYCASETDKHGDVIPMDKNKLWQSLRELTRVPKGK